MAYTLYRRVPLAADIPGELTVDIGTQAECKAVRKALVKKSSGFWTKKDFIIVRNKKS